MRLRVLKEVVKALSKVMEVLKVLCITHLQAGGYYQTRRRRRRRLQGYLAHKKQHPPRALQ